MTLQEPGRASPRESPGRKAGGETVSRSETMEHPPRRCDSGAATHIVYRSARIARPPLIGMASNRSHADPDREGGIVSKVTVAGQ